MSRAEHREGKTSIHRWYHEGLRFECTRCGDCCTGEMGYVFVELEEIDALAHLLGVDRDEFGKRYLRRVGQAISLIERPNGDCVFYREGSCTVYEARPRQCATYPFWKANVVNRRAWKRACGNCPGAGNPEARLWTGQEIEDQHRRSRI